MSRARRLRLLHPEPDAATLPADGDPPDLDDRPLTDNERAFLDALAVMILDRWKREHGT